MGYILMPNQPASVGRVLTDILKFIIINFTDIAFMMNRALKGKHVIKAVRI